MPNLEGCREPPGSILMLWTPDEQGCKLWGLPLAVCKHAHWPGPRTSVRWRPLGMRSKECVRNKKSLHWSPRWENKVSKAESTLGTNRGFLSWSLPLTCRGLGGAFYPWHCGFIKHRGNPALLTMLSWEWHKICSFFKWANAQQGCD